ncbi:MAG: hypothetical protein KBS81_11975 [Spirochaetales bacterium]|nr:hypothetical protein [Candidatus Physcosoma equi]
MDKKLYRKESIEKISSPDELNDYLKVASPRVWLVLAALGTILIGGVVWVCTASPELLTFFVN